MEKGAADALLTWAVLNGLPSAPHHFDSPPRYYSPWSVSHTHTHIQTNFFSFFLFTNSSSFFFSLFCFFDGGVIQCFPFFFLSFRIVCCASDRFVLAVGSFHFILCVCAFSVYFLPNFSHQKIGSQWTNAIAVIDRKLPDGQDFMFNYIVYIDGWMRNIWLCLLYWTAMLLIQTWISI